LVHYREYAPPGADNKKLVGRADRRCGPDFGQHFVGQAEIDDISINGDRQAVRSVR
jgi:hypothetical protein